MWQYWDPILFVTETQGMLAVLALESDRAVTIELAFLSLLDQPAALPQLEMVCQV